MRSDLMRGARSSSGYVDSRSRECGDGEPSCPRAPALGLNPLGLCDEHLRAAHARAGVIDPPDCEACTPPLVLMSGRYWPIAGAMCFACGRTTGGTQASEAHRHEARRGMRARLLRLYKTGDRGPEWVALLARCPADIREAFARRVTPIVGVESVKT